MIMGVHLFIFGKKNRYFSEEYFTHEIYSECKVRVVSDKKLGKIKLCKKVAQLD